MYSIQLPATINQLASLHYRLGLWHQGDEPTVRETRLKNFYSIYHSLFPISLLVGAISSDSRDESIFLLQVYFAVTVVLFKLLFLIWRKKQILLLLNQICVYSVDDDEEFTLVNTKIKRFMKFSSFLIVQPFFAAACAIFVTPFIGTEKTLFFNIAFPFDWKNNEIAYWMAFTFTFTQMMLSLTGFLMSIIIWTLMLSCTIKYELLGNKLRKMGKIKMMDTTGKRIKVSEAAKENKFRGDFIQAIEYNNCIMDEIRPMESFLSPIFFVQLATSGLCICGSIYCLIFNNTDNLMDYLIYVIILVYNIFEIFMVMYFGNEIQSSSDRLTYCVFESDWHDQSIATQKNLIVFAEILKRPYVLVVCKIYPLTLETFTRILNSAYSMFNILKNLK